MFGVGAEVTRKNVRACACACVCMSAYVCFNENVYQKRGPKPRRGFTNTITMFYLKGGDQISSEMADNERGAGGQRLSPRQNEPVAGGRSGGDGKPRKMSKAARAMTRERKP